MASVDRQRTPGRFATLAWVAAYLVAFWSWLPIPRRLTDAITRSPHRRAVTVLAVAIACAVELISGWGPAVVARGWTLWVPLGALLILGLGSAIAAWRTPRRRGQETRAPTDPKNAICDGATSARSSSRTRGPGR